MRKVLASIAVFLAAAVCASPAQAQPGPFSTVNCRCAADPASGGASTMLPLKCTISPSGGAGGTDPSDDILVIVFVSDAIGAPLPGSTVVVSHAAIGATVFIWDPGAPPIGDTDEDPQTAITNAIGQAIFKYDEGGARSPGCLGGMPNLDFTVTAQGPGPGGPVVLPNCVPDLTVHAYDLDADCDVDVVDFAIFASCFGVGVRGDFNHDGVANVIDFALFAANFGASCN